MKKWGKNNFINLLIAIIIILLLVVLEHFGILQKIDEVFAQTGLVEHFNEIRNSNTIYTGTVKTNAQIMSSVSENITIQQDKLNVLFLNVGQADCELVIANGKTMLIDAGNKSDGELVVNAIKALGISKLDYVIGTHVHEDHIGGMSYIIDALDVDKFYLPYNNFHFVKNIFLVLISPKMKR